MVAIPDQLVWECIRKNNSFLVKKSGHTKRVGKIAFSKEKGNLKSLHQLKYSGIANTKTIDIVSTDDNKTNLIVKVAAKASTYPNKTVAITNVRKDFTRSVATLKKVIVDTYYRRDLQSAALGKYTKIYNANRAARGIIKVSAVKKGRYSNKK